MKSSSPQSELRVLIDECLPVQLRHVFAGHDARRRAYGMAFVEERRAAERRGARGVRCIRDGGCRIPKNHDFAGGHLAVVVVPTNRRKVLDRITALLRKMVEEVVPGECRIIPQQAIRAARNLRRRSP